MRFTQLLAEYKKAPGVTRDRIYLDTVESVLSSTSKVMIDVKGGNNLLYLPLDKIFRSGALNAQIPDVQVPLARNRNDSSRTDSSRSRDNLRSREVR